MCVRRQIASTICSINRWRHIYNFSDARGKRDELVRFWGQNVKIESHEHQKHRHLQLVIEFCVVCKNDVLCRVNDKVTGKLKSLNPSLCFTTSSVIVRHVMTGAAPRFWKWGDKSFLDPPPLFGQWRDKILLRWLSQPNSYVCGVDISVKAW